MMIFEKDEATAALRDIFVSLWQRVYFSGFASPDSREPATGESPTVTICKAGSTTFGALAGSISECSTGVYKIALAAGDLDTAGAAMLRVDAGVNVQEIHIPIQVATNSPYEGTVEVGTKIGFSLAATGLDAVVPEAGFTLPDMIAASAAAILGEISGADTTSITIKAADDNGTTRIAATVDQYGNRSAITITKP